MCRKITKQKIINNIEVEKNKQKWEARKKSYSFGFD
jgi:hypothetical protein